ncbi:MAG: PAS domain-containing sensor histidine kinase, partial [Pseudomonadota bacterium]
MLHLVCKPNLIESPLNLMARKIPKETEKSPSSPIRNQREQVSPILVFKEDGVVLKAPSRTRLVGNSKSSKPEPQRSATVQSAPVPFKNVFDHTPAAIAIILLDGRFLEVNAAYLNLIGYSREELLGMVYADLIEPDKRAEVDECFSRCIKSEGNHPICSQRPYVRKTGEVIWCESGKSAIRDDLGNVMYVINHLHDVTFRNRAVLEAAEARERKNEFLAMLGHELRNPLNAIRHALQVSMESHDDPYMMDWTCGVLNRQCLQLTRMVDDLLDVARVNMRDSDLSLDRLDLRLVLARAQTAVRHLLNERGLNFISNDLPPLIVFGDEVRLEQVFVNLLHNAIKFTPEGGFIRLTGAREGTEIVISIADSGIGIAPGMVEQIFELFRQVSVPLARSQG